MKTYYMRLKSGTIMQTQNPEVWPEGVPVTRKEAEAELKAEAVKHLRKLLRPGDTVHCVLRHVSASGMSRRIDFYKFDKHGQHFLSGYIGRVLGLSMGDKAGLRVDGCGMDMGFHVVHNLGYSLWPDGFVCIGDKPGRRCPAACHSNGDRDYTKHKHDKSEGGYALRSAWL